MTHYNWFVSSALPLLYNLHVCNVYNTYEYIVTHLNCTLKVIWGVLCKIYSDLYRVTWYFFRVASTQIFSLWELEKSWVSYLWIWIRKKSGEQPKKNLGRCYTANVYRALRGVCRFSLHYLWKRAVRITEKPYTPQRDWLRMLWGNPVIFTDCGETPW